MPLYFIQDSISFILTPISSKLHYDKTLFNLSVKSFICDGFFFGCQALCVPQNKNAVLQACEKPGITADFNDKSGLQNSRKLRIGNLPLYQIANLLKWGFHI